MKFSSNFAGLFLAIASSIMSAQAAVPVARSSLAELSVIFFDDVSLTGAAYSPSEVSPGVCSDLPGDWLDRPESVKIGPGFACTLFAITGCEGNGRQFSGTVNELPMDGNPALYDNTESFSCNKQV